jgi:hypothetical protein
MVCLRLLRTEQIDVICNPTDGTMTTASMLSSMSSAAKTHSIRTLDPTIRVVTSALRLFPYLANVAGIHIQSPIGRLSNTRIKFTNGYALCAWKQPKFTDGTTSLYPRPLTLGTDIEYMYTHAHTRICLQRTQSVLSQSLCDTSA